MMHAASSEKTGQERIKKCGLDRAAPEIVADKARQGTSLRSRCQVSTMHTIHIEFANAMHDQLAGGRRQRHMICPTGGPLLSALVMAFGWTRAWVMDSVSLNWGPGGRV